MVTFATPESIEVSFRAAAFGTRVAAALVDLLILWLVTFVFWMGLVILAMNGVIFRWSDPDALGYVFAATLVLSFLLQTFYFAWLELRYEGQTFGKRRMRLRTVMIDGRGLTLGAALIRNLARIVDHTPIFWIVPLLTKGGRRAGDLLAGTLVIDVSEAERLLTATPLAPTYRELLENRFVLPAGCEQKLFQDDLNLLEHLFGRVERLPSLAKRRQLLEGVARKYVDRLGMADQTGHVEADPRRFLEELFLYLKSRFEAEAY